VNNKVILYIGSALLLSCEQKTEWDLQQSEAFVVADCIITNELKRHELKLYQSASQMNQNPIGCSGTAELSDGTNSVAFAEDPENPGTYLSNLPFRASAGKTYRLTVSYESDLLSYHDTAYAVMLGVTPLESFETAVAGDYFRYVFNPGASHHMLELHYDWSANPEYCEIYGACEAEEVFYNLGNIDIGKIFAPDRAVIRFPHNTRIIRRKYSLSPAHQEFIRSLLLETEWRGGVFDTEQGNVPTNFRRMRGWFGACMVVSDTTFFE
jgi:hypothetical protein